MDNKKQGKMIREVILRAVIEYTEQHGYAPTYAEIGAMVGLKSKNTVWNHIKRMIEDGMLETDADNGVAARAIRVPGYKFVKQEEPKTNADRIRNMTDEELAMNMMCPNECGLAEIECDRSGNGNCYSCLLEWLHQELEDSHVE